tara:strand:- start:269 stop:418 length:150 start_codon:yes stop_codon:yes gene_type:complete
MKGATSTGFLTNLATEVKQKRESREQCSCNKEKQFRKVSIYCLGLFVFV